jgi:putative DNA primase/helicase
MIDMTMDETYTTSPTSAIEKIGNIAAAQRAGIPESLLIPVIPPHASGLPDGKGLGKCPGMVLADESWRPLKAWQHGTSARTREACDAAGANCGLILGLQNNSQQFIAIDCDMSVGDEDDLSTQVAKEVRSVIIRAMTTAMGRDVWVRNTRPGRAAILLRIAPDQPAGPKSIIHLEHPTHGDLGKIELLSRPQQLVIAGDHQFTRRPIEWWRTDAPDQMFRAPTLDAAIPVFKSRKAIDDLLDIVLTALERVRVTHKRTKSEESDKPFNSNQVCAEDRAPPNAEIVISTLKAMPNPKTVDRDAYASIMHAVAGCIRSGKQLGRITAGEEKTIIAEAARWASRWDSTTRSTQAVEEAKLRSDWLKRDVIFAGWPTLLNNATNLGVEGIRDLAAEYDFDALEEHVEWREEQLTNGPPTSSELEALATAGMVPQITEHTVALYFAKAFQDIFKYDHDAEQWFWFDPKVGWKQDKTKRIEMTTRRFVSRVRNRDLNGWTNSEKTAAGKINFSTSVYRACRSDPNIATQLEDWNDDPYVLGYPGGHIDLRTGEAHPAEARHMIRHRVTVAPSETEDCPMWLAFLGQTTKDDATKQEYLQRCMGYQLTGSMKEELILFFYGSGGNGKGVVVSVQSGIFGDYYHVLPAELFKANSRNNREYYMAQMVGKRLLLASETEAGAALAESFVKNLTGNEGLVEGRHPSGRPFNFTLSAKLQIVGNHQPKLQGRDDAMQRRLHMLPFLNKPENPDPTLKERLIAERPGILRWMINGCLKWQKDGLGTCEAVTKASAAYFESQDLMSQWLEDWCEFGADKTAPVKAARDSFNRWLQGHGENPMTRTVFEETLTRKAGIARSMQRTASGEQYAGFSLKAVQADDAANDFEVMEEVLAA